MNFHVNTGLHFSKIQPLVSKSASHGLKLLEGNFQSTITDFQVLGIFNLNVQLNTAWKLRIPGRPKIAI